MMVSPTPRAGLVWIKARCFIGYASRYHDAGGLTATDKAEELKSVLVSAGADLVGFAHLELLQGVYTFPDALLAGYRSGVSIAVSLERYGRYDSTTERRAFSALRKMASILQAYVRGKGGAAAVIAPDRRAARKGPLHWRGELPHKAVARAAGLGWLGRSMLLVTPQFGPRVSLVTVLTDMDLPGGRPLPNLCGECTRCVEACTRNALRPASFDDRPAALADALSVDTCGPWIERTWREGNLCYDCMLACPWGSRSRKHASSHSVTWMAARLEREV